MNKVFKTAVFAFCLTAGAMAATVPVQNMSAWSLGAEYYGTVNGHAALFDVDESSLASHMLRLHYSPFEFVRFSAGIGASHSYANPYVGGSEAGLAATGGAALYLPRVIEWLSLTAGYDGYYLRASEKREGYLERSVAPTDPDAPDASASAPQMFKAKEIEGKTDGVMHVPYIGVIFHLGKYVDLEVGGQYRYFETSRTRDSIAWNEDNYSEPGMSVRTANIDGKKSEQFRLYGSLTFHERESGAFIVGGASAAPIVSDSEKNRGWLPRFSPYLQIGIVLRDPRGSAKAKSEYSDAYIDLKIKQDSMAEALNRDIERDMQRNREEGRDEHDFSETDE